MKKTIQKLRPGDFVEVKAPEEILQTLDAEGTLDQVPFMPEMVEFCGRRFRVSKRVAKTCASGSGGSTMRVFRTDDVVLLDELRCSGAEHDGCQKGCMIFWREAWLRKAEHAGAPPAGSAPAVDLEGSARLRARLKTMTGPKTYFCQASEILRATTHLSRQDRLVTCVTEVRSGNCNVFQ